MTDDGLGSPSRLTLDCGRHPPFLPGDEDPELVIGRRIVAAIKPHPNSIQYAFLLNSVPTVLRMINMSSQILQ